MMTRYGNNTHTVAAGEGEAEPAVGLEAIKRRIEALERGVVDIKSVDTQQSKDGAFACMPACPIRGNGKPIGGGVWRLNRHSTHLGADAGFLAKPNPIPCYAMPQAGCSSW